MKKKPITQKEQILNQGKEIALLKNELRELKTRIDELIKWKEGISKLFEELITFAFVEGGQAT